MLKKNTFNIRIVQILAIASVLFFHSWKTLQVVNFLNIFGKYAIHRFTLYKRREQVKV